MWIYKKLSDFFWKNTFKIVNTIKRLIFIERFKKWTLSQRFVTFFHWRIQFFKVNLISPMRRGGIYQFPSGRFIAVAIVNQPDEKLFNPTSVQWFNIDLIPKSRNAGGWKNLGVPVGIGWHNMLSPGRNSIGLTDLPKIPGSGIPEFIINLTKKG